MRHELRRCLALSAVLLLALPGSAWAGTKCERGYQLVQGNWISTPYCQDAYLADVAREYGFNASAAKIRNNPNYKKELCRYVFSDIRVQETCLSAGVPEGLGGIR